MALNPGQKDLARVDRQQDGLPDTAFPHSMLGVEAGGRLTQPNSVPSFFGEKQVVVSRRVCALWGYLARGH